MKRKTILFIFVIIVTVMNTGVAYTTAAQTASLNPPGVAVAAVAVGLVTFAAGIVIMSS